MITIKLAAKDHPPFDEVRSKRLLAILERGAADWNRWRSNNRSEYIDLRRVNLFERGASLAGADLREANLSDANLARVNLQGADLSAVYAVGADFQGAELQGAKLRGAYLQECNFALARLNAA